MGGVVYFSECVTLGGAASLTGSLLKEMAGRA